MIITRMHYYYNLFPFWSVLINIQVNIMFLSVFTATTVFTKKSNL